MMKKKLTVSVGIPAFNEEANIGNLLRSILAQKIAHGTLIEILVILDGCTDKTAEKVKEIKDKRVILHEGKKRLGKPQRLNQLFKLAKGDIIVLFDADVIIDSLQTIAHLIEPFLHDEKLGLVGGNPRPAKAKTFIEAAVNLTYDAYLPLRSSDKTDKNLFGCSCNGRILGLSRKFVKSVIIPENMIGNDTYLYYRCVQKNLHFFYQSLATVVYRSPDNLKDHIKQNTRFLAAQYIHKNLFGELVKNEYSLATKQYIELLLKQFIKMPLHAIFIFAINRYCQYLAKKKYQHIGSLWAVAVSSKKDVKI